jgi:prepilin-type N-terminal cleavage/methylation domain-containing protein
LSSRLRKEGFTLIELVLVIALVGVVAAVVLPRLDPFLPKRRLKSAVRLLSGTISLAYGDAIAKNTRYRLYFDTGQGKYWITELRSREEDREGAGAPAIRLGTQFELLQYEDMSKDVEQVMPTEPMFAPRTLPAGVHFSSVEIRRDLTATGLDSPYIEFNPLGSASPATIILNNDDGDGFVIRYDGVTGIPMLAPLDGST